MRWPHLCTLALAVLTLSGCSCLKQFFTFKKEDRLLLSTAGFSDLPEWKSDRPAEALTALQRSCKDVLEGKNPAASFGNGGYAGTKGDWQEVCLALPLTANDDEARKYFEDHFTPYSVWGSNGREGLFTGYYEPLLYGSTEKKAPYLTPLYGRPNDLITVNLGDFKDSLKGETVMGRIVGENLIPYHSRKDINKGALDEQKKEIVWVDSPVDAFFLHIQGSGQVKLDNGETIHVGYAAQNGHTYTAIGKELIARGALTKENVSMQTIRAWMEAHPDEASGLMDINNSFIFFRPLDGDGPIGAEGVPLTPGRSMAVDRKKIPYGAPLWLSAETPEKTGQMARLMVAQDTGGAITGAVRGDYFWGAGAEAAEKAGIMKSKGQLYILLPKGVQVPKEFLKSNLLSFYN